MFAVAAWLDAPFFTDQERALALTDAVTRLDPDSVADDVWTEATKHWIERGLADILTAVATINVWNRSGLFLTANPAKIDRFVRAHRAR